MREQSSVEPKTLAAAERQMRTWVLNEEIAEQTLQAQSAESRPDQLGDFITISREAGACGSQIADLVGRKLGWGVLDKNLLDQVADQSNLSRSLLEFVDETTVDWADGVLGTWFDPKSVPHFKYVVHLMRIMLAAARRGNVVLVGRGARFVLPSDQGLSVRLIAPEKFRAAQIVESEGLSAAEARQRVAEVDRGRREFVARFFHHDVDDPHAYDLVLNVAHFGPAGAAERIVDAYCR
jgi:hypothetical protein